MNGETLGIFTQMVVLFLVIGTGYVCKKLSVTNAAFDKTLSNVVLSVTLPAMILGSVLNSGELPSRSQIALAFLYSCIAYLLMIALSVLITRLMRVGRGHSGAFRFLMVFGNVGFLGFPVISAIYGTDALIYAAIFNLPFNFLVFTVGAWFVTRDVAGGKMEAVTVRTFLTPAIVSCTAAIALALLGVHNIPVLGEALDTLGGMTTPAALFVIGSQLANLPVRELFGGPRLWAAAATRLVLMPAGIWAVLRLFVDDALILGILVVTAAMPVANVGAMLCQKYDGDTRTMSQAIFVTTLFSLVTIPALVLVMG